METLGLTQLPQPMPWQRCWEVRLSKSAPVSNWVEHFGHLTFSHQFLESEGAKREKGMNPPHQPPNPGQRKSTNNLLTVTFDL